MMVNVTMYTIHGSYGVGDEWMKGEEQEKKTKNRQTRIRVKSLSVESEMVPAVSH